MLVCVCVTTGESTSKPAVKYAELLRGNNPQIPFENRLCFLFEWIPASDESRHT